MNLAKDRQRLPTLCATLESVGRLFGLVAQVPEMLPDTRRRHRVEKRTNRRAELGVQSCTTKMESGDPAGPSRLEDVVSSVYSGRFLVHSPRPNSRWPVWTVLLVLTLVTCRPCLGHDPELLDVDDEDGKDRFSLNSE